MRLLFGRLHIPFQCLQHVTDTVFFCVVESKVAFIPDAGCFTVSGQSQQARVCFSGQMPDTGQFMLILSQAVPPRLFLAEDMNGQDEQEKQYDIS